MKTKDLGAKNGNMKLKGQDLRQKEQTIFQYYTVILYMIQLITKSVVND